MVIEASMRASAPPVLLTDLRFLSDVKSKFGIAAEYEAQQLEILPQLLGQARRFIDIGANRGLYSYLANFHLKDAEIIAIEANPQLGLKPQQTVHDWPKRNNTLTVIECAVGDAPGVLPFHLGPVDTLGSLTQSDFVEAGEPQGTIEVRVAPLDELVPPAPRTVTKLDVEGFEYLALLGAARRGPPMNRLKARAATRRRMSSSNSSGGWAFETCIRNLSDGR